MSISTVRNVLAVVSFLLATGAGAAEALPSFTLTLKDHKFEPSTITVPAGTKVSLIIKNTDASAEEFESEALGREKIIPAGKEATVTIGPLKPGTYPFVGEFHEDTAKGVVQVQ